jgi:hypothetical protein
LPPAGRQKRGALASFQITTSRSDGAMRSASTTYEQ